LQNWKKSICLIFAIFWHSSAVTAGSGENCVEALLGAGYKVNLTSVDIIATNTGSVRYGWKNKNIQCDTVGDEIIRLSVDDKLLIENGFPSTEAAELFIYMKNENGSMLESCQARFYGVIETFDTIYLPKLRSFDADLEQIKSQFDENFSKISRDFFVEKYYEQQAPLRRLEAYDDLLNHGDGSQLERNECIFVADEALEREEVFQAAISDLLSEVDALEGALEKRDDILARLQNELSAARSRENTLLDELKKFEKPRKLAQIEEYLRQKKFISATELFEDISAKFELSVSDMKRLEIIAIEAVRPIPAADREKNKEGYDFLGKLDKTNKFYQNKIRVYSN